MDKRKQLKLPSMLTDKDIEKILSWFNEDTRTGYRDKTYFLLLIRNGLRSEEAVNLKYNNIFEYERDGEIEYYYRLQKSKSGKQADIPLTKDSYERILNISKLFKHRQSGYVFTPVTRRGSESKPLDLSLFRRLAGKIKKELNIEGMHLHALRHYFCQAIYEDTGDIVAVQNAARHSDIKSSIIYTKVTPKAVRKATECIKF